MPKVAQLRDRDRDRRQLEALHNALKARLLERMVVEGWSPDPLADTGVEDGVAGSFRCSLNDQFAATAVFVWFGGPQTIQIDAIVGVSYQRSYRVWPSLIGASHTELLINVDEIRKECSPVPLRELGEVAQAVEELVTPLLEVAVDWASPFAGVDALLEAISATHTAVHDILDVPVVLGAAGRPSEAWDALAASKGQHPKVAREWKADIANIETWLTGGAAVPDPTN